MTNSSGSFRSGRKAWAVVSELVHADYPHLPGRLYDCEACESECFCDPCAACRMRLSDCCVQCVFCALLEERFPRV